SGLRITKTGAIYKFESPAVYQV
ncbi:uncharacterized protein METZ01_LOCUS289346, partial [marine metagenome]